MGSWDPDQYTRYLDMRLRAGFELIARFSRDKNFQPKTIVDLGCGTGEQTAYLKKLYPQARVVGVDNNDAMLEKARQLEGPEWQKNDIAAYKPDAPLDLIFSSSALHWLEEQDALMPRLIGYLKSGGIFALQIPVNFDQPSHVLMRATAASGPWAETLKAAISIRKHPSINDYNNWFAPHCSEIDMWQTTYFQRLSGDDPIVDWVMGSGLRPYLDVLDEPLKSQFLEAYRKAVAKAYPTGTDGITVFPFPRLMIAAKIA